MVLMRVSPWGSDGTCLELRMEILKTKGRSGWNEGKGYLSDALVNQEFRIVLFKERNQNHTAGPWES